MMLLHTKQYSAVIQKLTSHTVIHHGAQRTSLYCSSKCPELHDGWMIQAHLGIAPVRVCVCILYIHVHVREGGELSASGEQRAWCCIITAISAQSRREGQKKEEKGMMG